jgi:hypothetical protein
MAYGTMATWCEAPVLWADEQEDCSECSCTPATYPQLHQRPPSWFGWTTGTVQGFLVALDPQPTYRPRHPEATALYGLVQDLYERVKLLWEERFEPRYGPWRGFYDEAVARYLDCGVFERGFARAYCDSCRHDFIVALSCKGRGLCPSCAAKRGARLGEFLTDQVLEPVDHVQWVFTLWSQTWPSGSSASSTSRCERDSSALTNT